MVAEGGRSESAKFERKPGKNRLFSVAGAGADVEEGSGRDAKAEPVLLAPVPSTAAAGGRRFEERERPGPLTLSTVLRPQVVVCTRHPPPGHRDFRAFWFKSVGFDSNSKEEFDSGPVSRGVTKRVLAKDLPMPELVRLNLGETIAKKGMEIPLGEGDGGGGGGDGDGDGADSGNGDSGGYGGAGSGGGGEWWWWWWW
ncbi:hypothetical protein L3X38_037115 [Prunus dulcis]|uniref:Uncharacterized protein n=1 Tax=Prunus dulcis TaxID=3755 RepID=A0AAD4YQZ3_PRUDU|nr:hypothetical protein L3X38_037115 [Prunus dulcis]